MIIPTGLAMLKVGVCIVHTHTMNIHKNDHKPDFFEKRLSSKKSYRLPNEIPNIAKLVKTIPKSKYNVAILMGTLIR